LEKIDLSKVEDVLGRNPLEEELDSIWGVPKRKRKSVEREEVKGVEEAAAQKEPQVLHAEIAKPAHEPAEAIKAAEPIGSPAEVKPAVEQAAAEAAIAMQKSITEESKGQGMAVHIPKPVMPKEEKEDDKGIEKTIQMVGFKLNKEFYGIDIIQVQEIIRMHEITMVPRTPEFVKGVVNLRGKVVPIISLRERFGIKEIEPTKETRIIIVRIEVGVIGFIVDAVAEVIRIPERLIEPPPATATSIETEYIKGVGKLEDNLIIILDLNKVLTKEKKEFLNF